MTNAWNWHCLEQVFFVQFLQTLGEPMPQYYNRNRSRQQILIGSNRANAKVLKLNFELHPDLQRDGILLGRFALCQVLLINDKNYPWFVLVPAIENTCDTIDLADDDHGRLWNESRALGVGIMKVFNGEKLNVAALGNVTPQLHVHLIVRHTTDPAWPAPIWGKFPMQPYDPSEIEIVRCKLAKADIPGIQLV